MPHDGPSWMRSLGLLGGLVICAGALSALYVYMTDDGRFDERLAECRMRWRSGDVAGARIMLLDLHAQDESHPEVLEALAELDAGAGNLAQAVHWLRQVGESDPQRAASARHRAAQLAMQLARVRDVEALAREAVRLDPELAEARRLLLRCAFILRQHRPLLEQSVELDRRGQLSWIDLAMRCVAHRASWDDDDHVAWLDQCLHQDNANAAVRAALAHYHAARDRNQKAWQVLEAAPAQGRGDGRILLARAELEIREGRFEQALATAEQFPKESDAESRAWLVRGRIWAKMGHEEAALAAFDNAARLDPYDPAPSYAVSQILVRRGQAEKAREHFDRSQHLKDLMGQLSRLIEATNPAYHPDEPVELTRRRAHQAFVTLGFTREAQILTGVYDASTLPLTVTSLTELAAPVDVPVRSTAVPGIRLAPGETGPRGAVEFTDIAAELNLNFQYDTGRSRFRWLMESLGGGVAAVDYDRDGWDDVYFSQAGALPIDPENAALADRLFRNLRGKAAHDVTAAARLSDRAYGQGCAAGDYDNDGFADLVVCNYGELLVFKNLGDGSFENAGRETGVASNQWSTSAAFWDPDRDGDLDLYVVNYLDAEFSTLRPCMFKGAFTSCRPFGFEGVEDTLWENLGDGRFVDSTAQFGLSAPNGKGLGVVTVDFERRGRESVFVANDTTVNFLFQPDASGRRFEEAGMLAGVAVNRDGLTEACMGIATGDIDEDGRFDFLVTNFQGETNTLYRCLGDGLFSDETERAGLAHSSRDRLGWGAQFLDVDCNGRLDLFLVNGLLHEVPQLPQLHYNRGTGRFDEISHQAGAYFRQPRLGRSVACLDWNRDRATDLVVTYQEGTVSLLENRCSLGNRIVVRLTGVASNRDAAGAVVAARFGDRTRYFHVTRNGGYFAANDPAVLVGCGDAQSVDELIVNWPSGKTSSWRNVAAGVSYLAIEDMDQLLTSVD
jgi:tetratricopeptide (TPR) repeat protein